MADKNRLRIRAKALDLDLAGEAEYITQAYEAIHPVLMERFNDSIEGHIGEPEDGGVSRKTMPLHKAPSADEAEDEEELHHIKLVMCNEVYNKIFLVERDQMSGSVFQRVIEFDGINRVFINRSQRDRFRAFFQFGKVLWRELTSAGKAAVKNSS